MEGNGRRLGWIAIAIGVLALVMTLSGRGMHNAGYGYGPYGGNQPYAYSVPRQDVGPQGNFGPGANAPQPNQSFRYDRGDQFGPYYGPIGRHGHGPGWFFFAPFFLIAGLLRLVLFVLLIGFVLRFFARRRGWGPWSGYHRGGCNQDPATKTETESKANTGDTQKI